MTNKKRQLHKDIIIEFHNKEYETMREKFEELFIGKPKSKEENVKIFQEAMTSLQHIMALKAKEFEIH